MHVADLEDGAAFLSRCESHFIWPPICWQCNTNFT